MQPIVRHVRNIDTRERRVLERVIGRQLQANQKVIIQVVTLGNQSGREQGGPPAAHAGKLPAWCNVYAGFIEKQIAGVEEVILERAELKRPSVCIPERLKQKHLTVQQRAQVYLEKHKQFAFSSITRYAVVRGTQGQRSDVACAAVFAVLRALASPSHHGCHPRPHRRPVSEGVQGREAEKRCRPDHRCDRAGA